MASVLSDHHGSARLKLVQTVLQMAQRPIAAEVDAEIVAPGASAVDEVEVSSFGIAAFEDGSEVEMFEIPVRGDWDPPCGACV
jgi:hypothetical protein